MVKVLKFQFWGDTTTGTICEVNLENYSNEEDEDGPRYVYLIAYLVQGQKYIISSVQHSFAKAPQIKKLFSVRYMRENPREAMLWSPINPFWSVLLLFCFSILAEALALAEHFAWPY